MSTRTGRMRRVTVTIPDELVRYVDRHAEATRTSRSQVIGHALAAFMRAEDERLAAEGYQFFAAEAEMFAAASRTTTAEVILANTEWEGVE
ncbi:MAG: ribbon-helix-helix domain-containing protein [Candidatus Promineofilum sp.]|nr:ribbon-helix-helix domain-containing protein [Promineifilum sp.]